VAIFWDQASIHTSGYTEDMADSEEVDIELISNVAYRPDLNGIEWLWLDVKNRFREMILQMKAANQKIDSMGLIEASMSDCEPDAVKKYAQIGFNNIIKGKTTQELMTDIDEKLSVKLNKLRLGGVKNMPLSDVDAAKAMAALEESFNSLGAEWNSKEEAKEAQEEQKEEEV
jgi:hypothetical protein